MEVDNNNEQKYTIKLKIFDTIHDFGKKDARNNPVTQGIIINILNSKLTTEQNRRVSVSRTPQCHCDCFNFFQFSVFFNSWAGYVYFFNLKFKCLVLF